jgi:hypothetical protein
MMSLSLHDKSPDQRTPKRLAAWLLRTFVAVAGVAAVLIAASSGAVTPAVVKEEAGPSSQLAVASTMAATTSATFRGPAVSATAGQRSFAFGYLEFDWDPNAPGGVPGFD